MAYSKLNKQPGDKLFASDLARIENGIYNNDVSITSINNSFNDFSNRIASLEWKI